MKFFFKKCLSTHFFDAILTNTENLVKKTIIFKFKFLTVIFFSLLTLTSFLVKKVYIYIYKIVCIFFSFKNSCAYYLLNLEIKLKKNQNYL